MSKQTHKIYRHKINHPQPLVYTLKSISVCLKSTLPASKIAYHLGLPLPTTIKSDREIHTLIWKFDPAFIAKDAVGETDHKSLNSAVRLLYFIIAKSFERLATKCHHITLLSITPNCDTEETAAEDMIVHDWAQFCAHLPHPAPTRALADLERYAVAHYIGLHPSKVTQEMIRQRVNHALPSALTTFAAAVQYNIHKKNWPQPYVAKINTLIRRPKRSNLYKHKLGIPRECLNWYQQLPPKSCGYLGLLLKGNINIRALGPFPRNFTVNFSRKDAQKYLVQRIKDVIGTHNIYFCAQSVTKNNNAKIHGEGTITRYQAVGIDFDFEKQPGRYKMPYHYRRILQRCELLGIPKPTIITFTGGGYHAIWFFKNWTNIADLKAYQPQRYQRVLQQLATAHRILASSLQEEFADLGADERATDLTRILRLPNFPSPSRQILVRIVYASGRVSARQLADKLSPPSHLKDYTTKLQKLAKLIDNPEKYIKTARDAIIAARASMDQDPNTWIPTSSPQEFARPQCLGKLHRKRSAPKIVPQKQRKVVETKQTKNYKHVVQAITADFVYQVPNEAPKQHPAIKAKTVRIACERPQNKPHATEIIKETKDTAQPKDTHSSDDWKDSSIFKCYGFKWLMSHVFSEGHRNSAMFALGVCMLHAKVPEHVALQMLYKWAKNFTDPTYSYAEIRRSLQCIYRTGYGLDGTRLTQIQDRDGNHMTDGMAEHLVRTVARHRHCQRKYKIGHKPSRRKNALKIVNFLQKLQRPLICSIHEMAQLCQLTPKQCEYARTLLASYGLHKTVRIGRSYVSLWFPTARHTCNRSPLFTQRVCANLLSRYQSSFSFTSQTTNFVDGWGMGMGGSGDGKALDLDDPWDRKPCAHGLGIENNACALGKLRAQCAQM